MWLLIHEHELLIQPVPVLALVAVSVLGVFVVPGLSALVAPGLLAFHVLLHTGEYSLQGHFILHFRESCTPGVPRLRCRRLPLQPDLPRSCQRGKGPVSENDSCLK